MMTRTIFVAIFAVTLGAACAESDAEPPADEDTAAVLTGAESTDLACPPYLCPDPWPWAPTPTPAATNPFDPWPTPPAKQAR